MTNHPTPVILSDEALAEIEARHKLAQSGFQPYVEVDNSLADIPALCQTVRALRDEIATAMKVLNPSMPENGLEDACRQRVQAFISADDNCDELEKQNTALRKQLAEERQRRMDAEKAAEKWYHERY